MRIPMPAEREETRQVLEEAMLRVCDLPDNSAMIRNEIAGNAIDAVLRLPQDGWPFARLCGKKSVENFMALHHAVLNCAVLAEFAQGSETGRKLEGFLLERDFAAAHALYMDVTGKMGEDERRRLAASEKAERLYFRPELRCELYIVLNPRRKFIFNMQSSLASGMRLVRPKKFPRTCAAVPALSAVRELILINLAQIRPDVTAWLEPAGLALLDAQKIKGWRG